MRVLVFGASITQGFWDPEGGWVNRLRKYYDERQLTDLRNGNEPTIFNLGISGDTTQGLIKRFRHETQARLWPNEEFVLVFSIGTNNALIKSDGTSLASPEEYAADIQQLINEAREFSDKIMLVEIAPCDDKLTNPVFWADISYSNERIAKFNSALRDVATNSNLSCVKIYDELNKRIEKGEQLLEDGLHPNAEGHEAIFEIVRPELDKLIDTK